LTVPDVIGFQTFNDIRHFLSSVSKILGYDIQPQGPE
jgi:trehalose-6-phosphate synthase